MSEKPTRAYFMKDEAYVFAVVGIFFSIICVAYWFWSKEQSGTVMLFLAGCLGLLPGGYLLFWSLKAKPRLEDQDANIEEGAGVVDVFPGSSIWPVVTGLGASFLCVGLIFGLWVTLVGGFLVASAFIGFIAESRRGGVH